MSEIEHALAVALREHAEGDVHVENLLDHARREGRGYRRRRRVAGLCAVVATVAVAAAVPALLPERGRVPAPSTGVQTAAPSASPYGGELTRPPLATGATPATVDPAVIAKDPLLLHLDLDPSMLNDHVQHASWANIRGLEQLNVQTARETGHRTTVSEDVIVQVSHDKSDLTPVTDQHRPVQIGAATGSLGRPGSVRWEPLRGVWAEVWGASDDATAVLIAKAVRLDHVRRCTVPFRLGWVPPGSVVDECSMFFQGGEGRGGVGIAMPSGERVSVSQEAVLGPLKADTTVGGRPAKINESSAGGDSLQIQIDFGNHVVYVSAEGRYDKATVLRIANAYADLIGTDPATWPRSPLG